MLLSSILGVGRAANLLGQTFSAEAERDENEDIGFLATYNTSGIHGRCWARAFDDELRK